MDTLAYIIGKYELKIGRRMPVEIPGVGRDNLAVLFAELGFKTGVEIGVQEGLYAEALCAANPGLALYGVDPWCKYESYREHVDQSRLDLFYEEAVERMAQYDWRPVRLFSVEAAQDFDEGSLDFAYIDGNHSLPYVIADLHAWAGKVRRGGIVSGHNFHKTRPTYTCHVMEAVTAYTDAYEIWPWFVLGRNDAPEGEKRDADRSWMWVQA